MIVRVHIDGEWGAREFARFFGELHALYEHISVSVRLTAFDAGSAPGGPTLQQISRRASPLGVAKIQFSSPGFTDLIGLGSLAKEVRLFIEFLIVHFRERQTRKLSDQEKEIAIAKARLEILNELSKYSYVDGTKDLEWDFESFSSLSQFFNLPSFDAIAHAILEGRIVRTELIDEDDSE